MDLPAGLRVIVRGWLNCNSVVMLSPGDNVVIDSGYCTHREETIELIASREGVNRQPLERLINTHCHADHMGGNAALASAFGCRVTIPEGEVKHVVPWTPESVWMAEFDQRADPFRFDDTIAAGDTFEGAGYEWQAHAAPGHDMDALMFFEPANRILISGDALWEKGMGFVWPEEGANPWIAAAHQTLDTIERLEPAIVIPGHGAPFGDVAQSIRTVRSRLDAYARDAAKNARHALKVVFAFALLDRGSMRLAEVPAYLARVPIYRRLSERFLGMDTKALADWMLQDLERAGAVKIDGETVRPLVPA